MDKRVLAVLAACFGTVFVSYAIRYGYGIFLPEMLPALGITKTGAGLIYSSYFIAYTILSPILGLLGDRYDTRVIISVFTAILGIGTFLMAYSSSVAEASLYFTLTGIGASACWAPVIALAQRWSSDKRRGITLGFIDAGSALGAICSGALVPLAVNAFGWGAGWMSLGSLGLLIAVINYTVIRNRPMEPGSQITSQPEPATEPLTKIYAKLMRDTRFWLFGLAYLLVSFSIIIPFTFVSTYAVEELTLSYTTAASLITVIGVTALVGKPLLGALSDRVGRIRMILLCMILIAAGCLGMAYATGALILFAAAAVFGVGEGAIWTLYAAAASDYFPKKHTGSIVGLWTVYLGIGSLLSPIIGGWLADSTGTLQWSFLLAAAAAVVSLILLVPVWRQPTRPQSVP
ncbi:MAG: MFS transporter [Dehalococcoidales bacterium]|nr:MFS transporter [Dehalococcoidales bacterium]